MPPACSVPAVSSVSPSFLACDGRHATGSDESGVSTLRGADRGRRASRWSAGDLARPGLDPHLGTSQKAHMADGPVSRPPKRSSGNSAPAPWHGMDHIRSGHKFATTSCTDCQQFDQQRGWTGSDGSAPDLRDRRSRPRIRTHSDSLNRCRARLLSRWSTVPAACPAGEHPRVVTVTHGQIIKIPGRLQS